MADRSVSSIKIADGSINKIKLDTEIIDTIDLAESAIQNLLFGNIPLNKENNIVTKDELKEVLGLNSAAYEDANNLVKYSGVT